MRSRCVFEAHMIAIEHINYMRSLGWSSTDVAAALGTHCTHHGWRGVTQAYAAAWRRLGEQQGRIAA